MIMFKTRKWIGRSYKMNNFLLNQLFARIVRLAIQKEDTFKDDSRVNLSLCCFCLEWGVVRCTCRRNRFSKNFNLHCIFIHNCLNYKSDAIPVDHQCCVWYLIKRKELFYAVFPHVHVHMKGKVFVNISSLFFQ